MFPCSVGNPSAGQREAGQSQQNDQKTKQRNEPGDTSAQRQQFLLKTEDIHVGGVDGDDLGPGGIEPPVSCGARDASTDCMLDTAGRLDEFTKAMVISALIASRGSHHLMITTAAQESKPKDENSFRKVQNVVTDCTAECHRLGARYLPTTDNQYAWATPAAVPR